MTRLLPLRQTAKFPRCSRPAGSICRPSRSNQHCKQRAIVDFQLPAVHLHKEYQHSLGPRARNAVINPPPHPPPSPIPSTRHLVAENPPRSRNDASHAAPRVGEPSVSSGPYSKSPPPRVAQFPIGYLVPPPRPAFARRRFLSPARDVRPGRGVGRGTSSARLCKVSRTAHPSRGCLRGRRVRVSGTGEGKAWRC